MTNDPVKQAWQASVETGAAPALEEVRAGADKFYRFVWWRNGVEYAACAVVVAGFAFYVFILPHVLQKTGSALIVIAAFYAAWQLHRRASAEPPERAGTLPISAFQRRQLARHRDALRGIFSWYMLPFVPGLLTLMAGSAAARAREASGAGWQGWLFLAVIVAVFFGIWWFNQRIANKLQRHIDEIDALAGDGKVS
jgi:hypothetical protein